MGVKKIHQQAYHRNGIGGHGAVISLFEVEGEKGLFVATSLVPDLDESLTPSAFQIERYGEQEAYVEQWLQRFATDTVALNVEQTARGNIAFAEGNSWRGADHYGRDLARAWRATCLNGERDFSYDPATEWYDEVQSDPAETARLIEQSNREAEEALGLTPGTLA